MRRDLRTYLAEIGRRGGRKSRRTLGSDTAKQMVRVREAGRALTEYQASVARQLSSNRTFDSYLVGEATILIEPNTTRYSRDLDCFHDSETRVVEAFAGDRDLLLALGHTLDMELNQPGYIRAVVRQGKEATKVEWAGDSDWRFMPTVRALAWASSFTRWISP